MKQNKKAIPILIISTAVCLIIGLVIWRIIADSVNISCDAALSSYNEAFDESGESVYNSFYDYAYIIAPPINY